jgi:hypothetical protein
MAAECGVFAETKDHMECELIGEVGARPGARRRA